MKLFSSEWARHTPNSLFKVQTPECSASTTFPWSKKATSKAPHIASFASMGILLIMSSKCPGLPDSYSGKLVVGSHGLAIGVMSAFVHYCCKVICCLHTSQTQGSLNWTSFSIASVFIQNSPTRRSVTLKSNQNSPHLNFFPTNKLFSLFWQRNNNTNRKCKKEMSLRWHTCWQGQFQCAH